MNVLILVGCAIFQTGLPFIVFGEPKSIRKASE